VNKVDHSSTMNYLHAATPVWKIWTRLHKNHSVCCVATRHLSDTGCLVARQNSSQGQRPRSNVTHSI